MYVKCANGKKPSPRGSKKIVQISNFPVGSCDPLVGG